MIYDLKIEILGSRPPIWRKFTADTNLPIANLTKYIRETMRLRYHNPYTYCAFRDDGTISKHDVFQDSDGLIVKSNVSWIKSTYAFADYFIIPNKKPEGGIDKTTKDEKEVTIKDVFKHSNRLVFEYQAGGPYHFGKHGWSLEIKVLSRDLGQIKHKCSKDKIIEYDSAGYGIREHCGDIDTQNVEQERWNEYRRRQDGE